MRGLTALIVSTALLLLLSCIRIGFGQRLCTPNFYNVGVENNNTLQYLNSIRDLVVPRNATFGITINFTYFPIKPRFATVKDITALDLEVQSQNLYAIVADYYLSLAIVTYTSGIPYFITGETEYSGIEYQNNLFQYQINHNQLNNTLFDLNTALQKQGYTIFTDGAIASGHFTSNIAGKIFTERVINQNTSDADIFNLLVTNKNLLSSHSWVLVYNSENLHQIERIFNQSGPAGVLTDSEIFIIPSVEEKQQYLTGIRRSSAIVYTFALENSQRFNQEQLEQTYLKDCFAHFVASIIGCKALNNPNYTLVMSVLNTTIRGDSGLFTYRQGIRYGITINVMTIDKSQSETNFLVKAGSWVQGSNPPYKVVYFNTNSIKSSLVKFAAVIDKPYIYRNRNGELTGISYDLIKLMAASLQFQFEIIFVPDGLYGAKLSDGNWTGMMKYLVEGKADMSANFMSVTLERLQDVDLSLNLMQSGLQMLVKRSIHQLDFFNVFYPFSWYVWISIVVSMFVLSFTLFVSDKISPNTSGKSMFTFLESFFLVLSSFLMSKVETDPKKPSARLFTLLLWFSTLFYMTTYVSNLVPFLVKPDESLPFTTITDLNLSNYKVMYINNTLSMRTARARWPALYQTAINNWPNEAVQPFISDAINVLLNKEAYVAIDSATTLNYERQQACSLKTYGPLEEVMYETMLMSRAFLFRDEVRNYLTSIRYTDYQKLEEKYYGLNRCPTGVLNPADRIPLSFSYFAGLFAAVGVGVVLGFLYILLHWISRRISLLIAKSRRTVKLVYGCHYESEVIKITKEGVWVKINGRQEVFFIANNSLHADPTKIKSAKTLNLRVGSKMQVQYFGKDSGTNSRIFARLYEESEWYVAEKNQVADEDSD